MPANGRLCVSAVPIAALDCGTVEAMWRLYARYYDHVDREVFGRDLAEKSLVFGGRDGGSGELTGFSTALFYQHRYAGTAVGIYFSGDTIVEPGYWGQTALHRAVVRTLLAWKMRHPLRPLYWYLICSGLRTYLSLVRNFPSHWPHHQHATPTWEAGLIDSLSRSRYGAAWHGGRGVVRLGAEQPALKRDVVPATPQLLALPEVAFFIRANPAYAAGDELAMIARVDARAVGGMVAKWLRKAA